MTSHLAFDLDGTLIDSSESVLHCLKSALIQSGLSFDPSYLTSANVGPPLAEMISHSLLSPNSSDIDRVSALFRQVYDFEGCTKCSVFKSVDSVLQTLFSNNVQLHLVTNKRYYPTIKILRHLEWFNLFSSIITPDLPGFPFSSKTDMLHYLSQSVPDSCFYIGDRYDDFTSSLSSGYRFALASWGFIGNISIFPVTAHILDKPESIENLLAR